MIENIEKTIEAARGKYKNNCMRYEANKYFETRKNRYEQIATKLQKKKIEWLRVEGKIQIAKRENLDVMDLNYNKFVICEYRPNMNDLKNTILYIVLEVIHLKNNLIIDRRFIAIGKNGGLTLINSKAPRPAGEKVLRAPTVREKYDCLLLIENHMLKDINT